MSPEGARCVQVVLAWHRQMPARILPTQMGRMQKNAEEEAEKGVGYERMVVQDLLAERTWRRAPLPRPSAGAKKKKADG